MRSTGFSAPLGWLIGIVTAGVAVGVAELCAVLVRPIAAPVIAVGDRIITLTPESVKRQAIGSAGTDDKTFLIAGTLILLALFGALVGDLAMRRLTVGLIGVALIGIFGCYCAATQADGSASDIIPTLVGTLVALFVLAALVRRARRIVDEPAPTHVDRRNFLLGTASAAGLAAVAGFAGRAALDARFGVEQERDAVKLPAASGESSALPSGAQLAATGTPWRTPNADFYRIDRALSIPQLDPGTWTLRLHGMVDRPMTITYAELLKRPLINRWITLNCVSNDVGGNLVSNALFRGALLADLLREAGVDPASDQLVMHGADGMTIGAPTKTVMDGRDSLLAVGMNGEPLPLAHGFPVRVIVPGLYGYISACKWVTDIEATTFSSFKAYWVQGGWATDPPLQLMSRIDRPIAGGTASVGQPTAIAGVAWDQHVGVARVEVQIDEGPWQPARLGRVPSADTWRQWSYAWTPSSAGDHVIRARAVNHAGLVQTATSRPVFPSGATGLDAVTVHAYV